MNKNNNKNKIIFKIKKVVKIIHLNGKMKK